MYIYRLYRLYIYIYVYPYVCSQKDRQCALPVITNSIALIW